MITKAEVIERLLGKKRAPAKQTAEAFAPANIALIKYWGKRNSELNLPVTSSLSYSLAVGTHTKVTVGEGDSCTLNGTPVASGPFYERLFAFCDLFREPNTRFQIETKNEIPTASGFASSSSGFAALVLALKRPLWLEA